MGVSIVWADRKLPVAVLQVNLEIRRDGGEQLDSFLEGDVENGIVEGGI